MRRVLIVANRTAGGKHLRDEVAERIKREPHVFTLVVPATPPEGGGAWTDGQAHAIATRRLDAALSQLRAVGAEIDGLVGTSRPMDAIADVLRTHAFDEIIVSTLPKGASRWLRMDLPHRAARAFGLPVIHVVAEVGDAAPAA